MDAAAALDAAERGRYDFIMADISKLAARVSDECLIHRVRQTSRLVSRVYDEALRPLGLQVSQFHLLVAIARGGDQGMPMHALADALVMDRTTFTRSVVPLERAGWVAVARDPDDGRSRRVLLTREGERLMTKAFPLWESAQRSIESSLGAAAAKQLHAKLSAVVAMRASLEPEA